MIDLNNIYCMDCLDGMKSMERDSVDCVVTDPPYGWSFMGREWDKALPTPEIWVELLRAMKPGAFTFIMSGTRQDMLWRLMRDLETAGFRTGYTSLYWVYHTGFPKAKKIGRDSGYSFHPKPSIEQILVCQKPITEKTIADNVSKWGTGTADFNGSRIPFKDDSDKQEAELLGDSFAGRSFDTGVYQMNVSDSYTRPEYIPKDGRYPANLIVQDGGLGRDRSRYYDIDRWFKQLTTGSSEVIPTRDSFLFDVPKPTKAEKDNGVTGEIDGVGHGNLGNSEGFDRFDTKGKNTHPTVKPMTLGAYLVALGCPRDGLVLDPFVGSGGLLLGVPITNTHTGTNRTYIGFDLDEGHVRIAKERLTYWTPNDSKLTNW